ncbi:hypothetical protein MJD09_00780, partial [bacterium]|nr:hypothetical protein [bacterium]
FVTEFQSIDIDLRSVEDVRFQALSLGATISLESKPRSPILQLSEELFILAMQQRGNLNTGSWEEVVDLAVLLLEIAAMLRSQEVIRVQIVGLKGLSSIRLNSKTQSQ